MKVAYVLGLVVLVSTSLCAQTSEVAITIYNNDLALVREIRTMQLSKGRSEIKFTDVASRIDPTSVYFLSLTAPDKVTILEQNFEYDVVNSGKILQKYIDQKIKLSAGENVSYEGVLLSSSGQDLVLMDTESNVKIINRETVKNISFPKLPEGLITRPTLVWKLDCAQGGTQNIEIGYLTNGIQWHAEYVAVSNQKDTELEMSGWVSIENNSGATYKEAKLKVVAGAVHLAQEMPYPLLQRESKGLAMAVPDGFQEKSFFEYHLYTLQRPATVADNQVKQISLFEPASVKVDKKYIYDGGRDSGKVRVELEFENKKGSGLGMPLPKGKIRVYKRDDDKSLIFVGEDFVEHTPKDEKVRVYVGDAFDIVGERVMAERRRISDKSWEESWQIKLRNHKEETVEVVVAERLSYDWEILRKSHDYTKKDAQTIEFTVNIPADKEVVVEYLVRYNR